MYIGINENKKYKVKDADAFCVACEMCNVGTKEEQKGFMQIAKTSDDIEEFAERLVEWFYSGNWIYEEE